MKRHKYFFVGIIHSTTPTVSTVCVKSEGMKDYSQIPTRSISFPNNNISSADIDKVRPGSADGPLTVKETSTEKPILVSISFPPEGVQVGQIKVSPDELLDTSVISQRNIESFDVSYKIPNDGTLYPLLGGKVKYLVKLILKIQWYHYFLSVISI